MKHIHCNKYYKYKNSLFLNKREKMILFLNPQNSKTTLQSFYINITKRPEAHLEFSKTRNSILKCQNQ